MKSIKNNELKLIFASDRKPETSMFLSYEFYEDGICAIKIQNNEYENVFNELIYDPNESLQIFTKLRDDIDDFLFRINEYVNLNNKKGK